MSVSEPSNAVDAGMAKQNEGRRLTLSRKTPSSVVSSLVGWLTAARVFVAALYLSGVVSSPGG